MTIEILGRQYPVRTEFFDGEGRSSCVLMGEEVVMRIRENTQEVQKKMLVQRVKEVVLKAEIERIMKQLGERDERFAPIPFIVKRCKSLWGCYNISQNSITFNSELTEMPYDFLEYIVLHEMCHRYHCAHDDDFYGLVAEMMPDWKAKKRSGSFTR